jgi:hypothetical protein
MLGSLEDPLDGFLRVEAAPVHANQVRVRPRMIRVCGGLQLVHEGHVDPGDKGVPWPRVGVGGRDHRHTRDIGHRLPSQ